ncbi:endonuclease III [Candidatus Kaiserbacteria bacterium]|nr:endonuclease III [Candidatus Kaiserbacteria bacterium]
MTLQKFEERQERARKIVAYLKRAYPRPKSELVHQTPFQFVASVMLSAQCTDKVVNRITAELWKKYKTARDFARADPAAFTKEISSIPFFRNKAKAIIAAAKIVNDDFGGLVPRTEAELVALPGIGYKTAHVILGELYGVFEGIPTDTHVKRFAKRFDLTDNSDLKKISKDLEALIPKKDWKYVNNGLVLYGRYVCPARPHDCTNHPLTKLWPRAAKRWPRAK